MCSEEKVAKKCWFHANITIAYFWFQSFQMLDHFFEKWAASTGSKIWSDLKRSKL